MALPNEQPMLTGTVEAGETSIGARIRQANGAPLSHKTPDTQVGAEFASHETVNHGAGEYVRGDVYRNTVEGFFSQRKRSIDGPHHHVSEQQLHRYVAEFDFRESARKIEEGARTERAFSQVARKRLMYRDSLGGVAK